MQQRLRRKLLRQRKSKSRRLLRLQGEMLHRLKVRVRNKINLVKMAGSRTNRTNKSNNSSRNNSNHRSNLMVNPRSKANKPTTTLATKDHLPRNQDRDPKEATNTPKTIAITLNARTTSQSLTLYRVVPLSTTQSRLTRALRSIHRSSNLSLTCR